MTAHTHSITDAAVISAAIDVASHLGVQVAYGGRYVTAAFRDRHGVQVEALSHEGDLDSVLCFIDTCVTRAQN